MTNRRTYGSRSWRRWTVSAALLAVLPPLSGCFSPIALHRAVMEYDRATANIQAEMLLLNIARAGRREPLHFTAVSSVAATFNFQVSAGWLGRIADNVGTGSAAALTLGASASENPTVTIIPVEGEAFTKRMLTPIDEHKFLFLAQQGVEPSRLLRLLATAYVDTSSERRVNFRNDPRYKDQYIEFRRIVLHIASLALADVIYPHHILDYGRTVITNYELSDLSNDQRQRLNKEAERLPEHAMFVDIRPDGPGGEYPLHGYFHLRSFLMSLVAIARSMSSAPEFDVEKDPRTGPIPVNPTRTMAVQQTADEPNGALFKVRHAGFWYWIPELPEDAAEEAAWDQEAFLVLNGLYNMTVTDVSQQPRPAITIAK